MASSDVPIDPAAARRLGSLLTGTEARGIADRLTAGESMAAALLVVSATRRREVRSLLETGLLAGLPGRAHMIALLRAIEGARSVLTSLDMLWTMPGHLARSGPLTSSVAHLVDSARQSVTCSTFNFQRSSSLWEALRRAAHRPECEVRVYLDTPAADQRSSSRSPSTAEVAAHLHPGVVLRTKQFDGDMVRNHAKLIAVDHRLLLVTSANFSRSAEHSNVEFGVVIDDPGLTEAVERQLHLAVGILYEPVPME